MFAGMPTSALFSGLCRPSPEERAASDLRYAAKQLLEAAAAIDYRVTILEGVRGHGDYDRDAMRKLTEDLDETRWRLGFLGRSLDAFYNPGARA